MIVRIVTCRIRASFEAAFEAATRENHLRSLEEPGVLRFDVLEDTSDERTYYLYEVYRDEEAAGEHKKTNHYKVWRDAVEPWMETNRTSLSCSVIAPVDPASW